MDFSKLKLKFKKEGKHVYSEGHYKDLLHDVEYIGKNNTNNKNKSEYDKHYRGDDHTAFAGGVWDDITNLKNMKQFQDQLKEFQKHKIEEKLSTKLDFNMKRTRKTSEHDGDYDLDKRWEIKPFNSAIRTPVPINIVDIIVDMSISSGMKSNDINAYGAMVWAVIQLVEKLGIQCNVKVVADGTNYNRDGNKDFKQSYVIKKSGEYISPIAMASCFQSVFLRRAMHGAIVLAADFTKEEVSYGLGYPRHLSQKENILFKDGAIYTKPGGLFKIEEVENCLIEMLKVRK